MGSMIRRLWAIAASAAFVAGLVFVNLPVPPDLVPTGGGGGPVDPVGGQAFGDRLPMGGTADGDAMIGAAEAFRQAAASWRANDMKRSQHALELARRWLATVQRPESAVIDERASRLAQAMAVRALDVPAAAEQLARDATLIAQRYGGAVPTPWASARPVATPTPAAAVVAPMGAPGPPMKRPPGMGGR